MNKGHGSGFAIPVKRVSAALSEIYSPEVMTKLWFGACGLRPWDALQTALPGGEAVYFFDGIFHAAYRYGDQALDPLAGSTSAVLLSSEAISDLALSEAVRTGVFSGAEHARFIDALRTAKALKYQ